jgi:hypothetical protein
MPYYFLKGMVLKMLGYIEYLNLPVKVAIGIVAAFLVMQVAGEFLEFKGKVVPEFVKIRKYFARKKKEREALSKVSEIVDKYEEAIQTIEEVKRLLTDIDQHYSKDNIAMRDGWMKEVNKHIVDSDKKRAEQDALMRELNEKLDRNNEDTKSILIENKRSEIIRFASVVIDEKSLVTREQFKRIFKLHEEYEEIIEETGRTNGEIDIAYRIITESYENHMKNHSFIEETRGYDI